MSGRPGIRRKLAIDRKSRPREVRQYVLDASVVVDPLTGVTSHEPRKTLDGALEIFVAARLLAR